MRGWKSGFAAAVCAVLASGVGTAATPSEGVSAPRLQRIGEFVDQLMTAGEVSGAVTLVARQGRIVHLQAQGLADLATKRPMKKDDLFRIASMTKPIVATAVLMLVEEGRIRLDDPVSRFIPAFRDVKVAVARAPAPGVGPELAAGRAS